MLRFPLSEGVALEILEPRHAEGLFRCVDENRDHLRPWMPWVDGTRTPDDTLAFIRGTQRQFAGDDGVTTAIVVDGEVSGVVGLRQVDRANRSTSIGYWLAAPRQGRGIVTAACRLYVAHAFHALGLNRIEIRAAVENRRSRAVAERLGFRLEGTVRQAEWLYDHFLDHAVYGLLRDEWEE